MSELFIRCPRCERPYLTEADFGICRARSSGRNLYCRACIRAKIAAYRTGLREYNAVRNRTSLAPRGVEKPTPPLTAKQSAKLLRRLSPTDRVREAIRCGAKTQTEIIRVTKLPKDEVGDAIAHLLLWSRDIQTRIINDTRMYFTSDDPALPKREPIPAREPRRSNGVSPVYSTIFAEDYYAA